jgi:hypothetical protein
VKALLFTIPHAMQKWSVGRRSGRRDAKGIMVFNPVEYFEILIWKGKGYEKVNYSSQKNVGGAAYFFVGFFFTPPGIPGGGG